MKQFDRVWSERRGMEKIERRGWNQTSTSSVQGF